MSTPGSPGRSTRTTVTRRSGRVRDSAVARALLSVLLLVLIGIGVWAWWGLVGLLAVLYFMKAEPGSIQVLVISGLVLEVVTLTWAWWADRHRDVADSLAPTPSAHP